MKFGNWLIIRDRKQRPWAHWRKCDIVRDVCVRYLRFRRSMTVREWNDLVDLICVGYGMNSYKTRDAVQIDRFHIRKETFRIIPSPIRGFAFETKYRAWDYGGRLSRARLKEIKDRKFKKDFLELNQMNLERLTINRLLSQLKAEVEAHEKNR